MPSASEILNGLSKIANSWTVLAILWHVYFAAFAVIAMTASRLTKRLVAAVLIPPFVSVGVLALAESNPFNGAAFCLLSIASLAVFWSSMDKKVERAGFGWLVAGLILAAFGWTYPHFLEQAPDSTYLYASPLGLIPCPTLAMAAGITMIFGGLQSRAWSLILASAAIFYGAFGALYLGVTIDWVLAVGGVAMLGLVFSQGFGRSGVAA